MLAEAVAGCVRFRTGGSQFQAQPGLQSKTLSSPHKRGRGKKEPAAKADGPNLIPRIRMMEGQN